MSGAAGLTPAVRDKVAAAACWRLLAHLFTRPGATFAAAAQRLATEVARPALVRAAELAATATESGYLALLGPGARASPREAAYAGMEDPGRVLAELAAYYRAFAFSPRTDEPADHVCVEADFVGYLWLKEAFAEAAGEMGALAVLVRARTRFVADHVRRLATGLHHRLDAGAAPYLAAAAAVLWHEAGGAHAPHVPVPLAAADEGPFACQAAGCRLG